MVTIDREKMLELAVHVKLVSEAIVAAAHHLTTLRPDLDAGEQATAWSQAIDELIAMNVEVGFMERILRGALHQPVTTLGVPRLRA
jgi:hypothetical protein